MEDASPDGLGSRGRRRGVRSGFNGEAERDCAGGDAAIEGHDREVGRGAGHAERGRQVQSIKRPEGLGGEGLASSAPRVVVDLDGCPASFGVREQGPQPTIVDGAESSIVRRSHERAADFGCREYG